MNNLRKTCEQRTNLLRTTCAFFATNNLRTLPVVCLSQTCRKQPLPCRDPAVTLPVACLSRPYCEQLVVRTCCELVANLSPTTSCLSPVCRLLVSTLLWTCRKRVASNFFPAVTLLVACLLRTCHQQLLSCRDPACRLPLVNLLPTISYERELVVSCSRQTLFVACSFVKEVSSVLKLHLFDLFGLFGLQLCEGS